MAAETVSTHGQRTCTVEVSPAEVDAGAELTVTARVACPHGCDLSGQSVSIRNCDGAELARAELGELDGETSVASILKLRAPLDVGEHVYQVVLAADEKDAVLHQETATAFSFAVMAHAASVNVWGLPSAIAAGEPFTFTVGIKCSAGCTLAGRPLTILDDEGVQIAAASLATEIWPGTSALYFAEVNATAPPAAGDHHWQVVFSGSESGVPHAAGACRFALKVVGAPDHEVTVEAVDSETQAPIAGAHVLLHPYRALTDERGVAKVKVAKGRYSLFVSGFNYIAYEAVLDVAGDVTARAELAAEPEDEDDYPIA